MDHREFVEGARVVGSDGSALGSLVAIDTASQPPSFTLRRDDDGQTVTIPLAAIDTDRSSSDRIVIDRAPERLGETMREAGDEAHTIPLASEELVPHWREAPKGRVLVHKRVESIPVEREIEVEHDEVEVERIAIGREVDTMPEVRHEGGAMIVPVVEEVLVVEKRLRLVEELRVTRRRVSEVETVRDEVRREVVDIEERPPGQDV